MAGRLVLSVVLGLMACMTLETMAQNTTMSPSNTTMGGGATTMGGGATTMGGGDNATMGGGATTMVGGANATMGGGATTMGGGDNATMGGGATTMGGGATMMGGGANATTGGNVTAAPTAAPTTALITNLTVETLTINISRAECGVTRFCASEPSSCDPAAGGFCFFLSTREVSGQTLSFQLRGEASGYIAVVLSPDTTPGDNDTTYVCANNNGTVKFFTTLLNNGVLIATSTLPVNMVKGSVSGGVISCTFTATVPSASSTRAAAGTSYVLSLSDGTFTNGTLGAPQTRLRTSGPVDLANPNSTATNAINATAAPSAAPTAAATTASHAVTLQRSLSQAALILLGVLGLAML